jgi:2',3'-cyclic-nucleotide 2'-phosphodiesterase (5'-nucleotidase family)
MAYPVVIAEGGDFLSDRKDTLRVAKAELIVDAMSRMGYDAVGPGERELDLGLEFLRDAQDRIPLVSGNIRFFESSGIHIPAVRWADLDGHRVAVTAYLDPLLYYNDPSVFEDRELVEMVADPVESLQPVIDGIREEADLVVVIAHGERPGIDDVMARLSGADVFIQGHEPRGDRAVRRVSGAYLMVPVTQSREVDFLTVTRSATREDISTGYGTWRLSGFKDPDPRLEELVHDFQARHGLAR